MLLVTSSILVAFEDLVLRGLKEGEAGVNDKKLLLTVLGEDKNKETTVFEDTKEEV